MAKNYYDILGVPKGSSDDEIKKAYRKLAHKYHPDKSGGDEAKFKEINEAYQVLSDKAKRSQYDQFGQTFNQGGSGGQGGFSGGGFEGFDFGDIFNQARQGGGGDFEFGGDFSDIFSDIFGGGGTRGRRKARGRDIQVDLEIDFSEMVKGAQREVRLYKNAVCDRCHGTGAEPGTGEKICPTCKGAGRIQTSRRSIFGTFSQVSECPECHGAGTVPEKICSKCKGAGSVKEEQRITVGIPAGIENGQTISMQGQGEAGGRGVQAGDLYVTVHVRPHAKFERKGQDILSSEYISFSTAVLGGKIEIETIDGSLILKIPSGTKSGETFRVKEKGVPELHGRGRGSQLVKVVIETPKNLSREQRDLIEKLKSQGI
jgi:molecular chaperone DnaJ